MDYHQEDEDEAFAGYLGTIEQKEKEELEFYTDLAVQEMQRWIEAVTRKKFRYSEDPKSSLADGILLCELLNGIMPGTIKRINRLPTPMAGMDNLNVFIAASKTHFGLKEAQLFTPTDLQGFAERSRDAELSPSQLKDIEDKKIRNVAITVFWLARQVQGAYVGPQIDFTNFTALVNAKSLNSSLNSSGPFFHQHQYSSSGDWTEPDSTHYKHSRTSSRDSTEDMRRSSGMERREGRYSSSDSLDDLDRPNSQNSDRSGLRRTSTAQPAIDPLQFVALKPAVNLAQKAEKQLELAQETKKRRESVDKDEAEWQFNLSSWKQRRKSSRKSVGILPERVANEIQAEKYQQYESMHRDQEAHHYSQSQSSQSYDDDETFSSPTNHQKSSSDDSSSRDRYTPGSTAEFKPQNEEFDGNPILDIIERATIRPVESQPLQSASLKSSGSMQHSMGKNKMRIKLMTEVGSDDGFGFTIKGGKDKCLPITIESVTNDSAADKAELLEGDEVLEINDEVVTDRNRGYCMLLINGSLQKNGKLDMYIKRDYSKVSTAAKERKQSSNVAPKSILDVYESMESKPSPDSDSADGIVLSTKRGALDDMEGDCTSRELEREYRRILDGGYDSAVSTLRSELTMDDRQAYLENQQEKVTATTAHASYMSPPSEYISPQEYDDRGSISEDSFTKQRADISPERIADDQDSSDEESMETFEQIHDKVTKDFEEAAPSLLKNNDRFEKRSKKIDEVDNRKRMEEWQKQQEKRQQEQFEKEQQEMQRQIEKSRQEAEEYERNRKNLSESPPTPEADGEVSSTLSSLRLGINSAKERETRDKAVQRLLEIKARHSKLKLNPSSSDSSNAPAEPAKQDGNESDDEDDDLAKYRLNNDAEPESKDMRDRYTANYFDFKPTESENSAPKDTPYLTDVYKYYDEDLPSNLGERDPTPPPMSRKDVMNMNKKSTPWQDANKLPSDGNLTWERKEVIAPVSAKAAPPWKRPEAKSQVNADRRKSAPTRQHWMDEDSETSLSPPQRASDKQTDVDPTLPSTLRKEDVLKMTREKARFSAQSRRASEAPLRTQPINHKKMNAVPVPVRKSASDWVKVQSEDDSAQSDGDNGYSKPQQRKSMGFFSNRAMFEQQSREADKYWADQSKEPKKQPVKYKPGPVRKAASTVQAPQLRTQNRSKSVDVRPPREDVVRSVDASDAAYERMKELAQMKRLREEEAAKAEDDERERRNRDRKARDERQREIAEIRKMNQQYEAANSENARQQQYESSEPSSRSDELDKARRRMAREAEELARAQMRHDEDVKTIHGVDMQEERRRRDIDNNRPSYDDEHRHSRELGDLDRDERSDAMARRRHQELVEQSRRDQQRREEAKQIQQKQQKSPPQKHPQQLHHSQQQQQQEWRPQQLDRYNADTPPAYSKPNADKSSRYRTNGPAEDKPRNNSQPMSPEDNNVNTRYNDSYAPPPNGYDRRDGSNEREPAARYEANSGGYQAPYTRQNEAPSSRNPHPSRDEPRNPYKPPQEVRSDIKPQVQNTQRSDPPLYQSRSSAERTAPKAYERQQPIGHSVNHLPQDSYDRDIPASRSHDRLNNDHRKQGSYDRNLYSGYSSSNDGYSDSNRPYSNDQGRIPNYRQPDPTKASSRNEDPRYPYSNTNGGTPNLYNNNDVLKRDMYSKEKSPETSSAPPSKPPRGMQSHKRSDSDDVVTVSAKYNCAYCSKELGKGAAMVIESLGLYYHVDCFRCCVCHTLLSNGQMGADVRVRVNRLHCKNCYSNDDAGIKYSAV